jgi:hypothetical protein
VSLRGPTDGGPVREKEEAMAQALPLPSPGSGPQGNDHERHLEAVPSLEAGFVECSLCGSPLGADRRRFSLVSPIGGGKRITVCSTCHRAALGEGYRPAV